MTYDGDGRLPVVYVRGFAGGGINTAVDDPFYGFNEGSIQVRVDGADRPAFHQFESPLLRLMIDHDYDLRVHGDQRAYLRGQGDGKIPAATLWIHRFYDEYASILTKNPESFSLETAASSLLDLVQLVLVKTGAPRVFLVAHSMGGLIVRSLLQRTLPDDPTFGGRLDAGTTLVDRAFTYATPHGGIEFVGFGLLERLRDATGILGADIFGPERMHQYLTPVKVAGAPGRAQFDATRLPAGSYPLDRFFCLVGTDAADYGVALGLSSQAVGARSDGLVQIQNAALVGAPSAFVHRSHSGRFGIVNSEEGYQNLRRFLFGDLAVTANLVNVRLPGDANDNTAWQLQVALSIRGLPVVLHEKSAAHQCPIQLERGNGSVVDPVRLVTTYLSSAAARPTNESGAPLPTMRHVLRLRLSSLRQKGGLLSFLNHLEQTSDWSDTLVVDIGRLSDDRVATWAAWNSVIPGAISDWDPLETSALADDDARPDHWHVLVPLPEGARRLLGPDAAVELLVEARQTLDQAGR